MLVGRRRETSLQSTKSKSLNPPTPLECKSFLYAASGGVSRGHASLPDHRCSAGKDFTSHRSRGPKAGDLTTGVTSTSGRDIVRTVSLEHPLCRGNSGFGLDNVRAFEMRLPTFGDPTARAM